MADANKQFIYTITTGRSGTAYLTELLKRNIADAEVYHERWSYTRFGIDTPDASHFTLFNSVGNVAKVRAFWQQKFERDAAGPRSCYAELSHPLPKAGLIENLDLLRGRGVVHLIVLKRDILEILWSFMNRFDFENNAFTWLFTLDPSYPNVIVRSEPLRKYGAMGIALWYIVEMFTRAEYYRLLLSGTPDVLVHDASLDEIAGAEGAAELLDRLGVARQDNEVRLPDRKNETKSWFFGEAKHAEAKKLVNALKFDPVTMARKYYESGRRLGTPKVTTRGDASQG